MISIIICSINPSRFQAVCEQYRRVLGNEPHEIIGVHDARSMCEGYNRGLARSRGEIVIFSHDDIEIWAPEFTPRLKQHLHNFDIIGVAGTNRLIHSTWIAAGPPHIFGQVAHVVAGPRGQPQYLLMVLAPEARVVAGICAMDGVFLAARADVARTLGWDQDTFTGFHCYDLDFTYRAFQAGYRLGVAFDLPLLHMSPGVYDARWEEQSRRLLAKHGLPPVIRPRFHRILAEYSTPAHARAAMVGVYSSLA